jgi:hypothetical protein
MAHPQSASASTPETVPLQRTRRWGPGLLVLAWALFLPVAGAWKAGVRDDPTAAASGLPVKHVFEPLVTGLADRVIGLTGAVLFVAVSVAILAFALRGWFDGRWWFVMFGCAAVGVPAGWAYRVTTAAYVDANIGGPAVAVGIFLWSAVVLPFVVMGALAIAEDPDPID